MIVTNPPTGLFIAEQVSSIKLSNEQWLDVVDALAESIIYHRHVTHQMALADKIADLVVEIEGQMRNGPVPEPEDPRPSVDEIPEV